MSTLTLVPKTRPPAPVAAGAVVRVPSALPRPSGRWVPKKAYAVLEVHWGPDLPAPFTRPTWRLVVEARLDCSRLGDRFRAPTRQERLDAAREGVELATPLSAEATRVYLDAGEYVSLHDDQLLDIPDHPLQND